MTGNHSPGKGGASVAATETAHRSRRRCALSLVFVVVACGAPPKGADAPAPALAPKFAPGPWAAGLAAACTPAGPELCFNATDDNCNGVIDEGCGVCTGPLQFAAAWSEAAVDIDLVVIDPTGARVDSANRGPAPSGLKLDRDCPRDNCGGQNIENICSENLDPPRGRYVLELRLSTKGGAVVPNTKVRVGVRVGDKSYGADLELSPLKEQETVSFQL